MPELETVEFHEVANIDTKANNFKVEIKDGHRYVFGTPICFVNMDQSKYLGVKQSSGDIKLFRLTTTMDITIKSKAA